jgi:hypothetical protein
MKTQFSNKYGSGISKPLGQIQSAFFAVSSLTSGVCIGAIIQALIGIDSPALFAIFCTIGVVIASVIDFVVIKQVGKFAFTELFAWFSGKFQTPLQRKINVAIFCSIVSFGIFLSFVSSWQGSDIAAQLAPRASAVTLAEVAQSERRAVGETVKPYAESVKSIEAKIGETVKSRTNGELQRLAKQGNSWAAAEIRKIQADVERSHAKELAAAKTALQKAEDREQGRADKVISLVESETKEALEASRRRTMVIWNMMTFLGVLPLIFAVFLLLADCNNRVLMSIPVEQRVSRKTGGAGARSSEEDFDELYTNP